MLASPLLYELEQCVAGDWHSLYGVGPMGRRKCSEHLGVAMGSDPLRTCPHREAHDIGWYKIGVVNNLRVVEEPLSRLDEYATIPISFVVKRVLNVSVQNAGLDGIRLDIAELDTPWIKDSDAIKGEGPTRWPKRFDMTNWGMLAAYRDEERVGGAVIAFRTPEVRMLEDDAEAVLWDLRVQPTERSRGVGTTLFAAAEDWCRRRGCRVLKVETQNINVPACRLYAHMGCTLGAIDLHAYRELGEEVQLVWFKKLTS